MTNAARAGPLAGQHLHAPDLATVLTGDTLFQGRSSPTGRSFGDRPTILQSIRSRLRSLHVDTVGTGHGDDTTISAELGHIH